MSIVKQQASPDVMIVDCDHMAHRAYHVFGHLSASDATSSGVVYGVLQMLKTQLSKVGAKQMILTWGASGAGKQRKAISSVYKATRQQNPHFQSQLVDIQLFFSYMYWEQYFNDEGWEADDVIATLALFYAQAGKSVVILSGDHDFHQLVSDRITCVVPGTRGKPDVHYTPAKVLEIYGVPPELLPDVFALCGETGDNVEGVPSVGETTAQKLIQEFGAVETWLDRVNDLAISQKIKENIQANVDLVRMNLRLVNLRDSQVSLCEIERQKDTRLAQVVLNKYEIAKFSSHDFYIQ